MSYSDRFKIGEPTKETPTRYVRSTSSGYSSWKNNDPRTDMTKVVNMNLKLEKDFPSLSAPRQATAPPQPKGGVSLAEKLKMSIAKDEEEANLKRFRKSQQDKEHSRDEYIPLNVFPMYSITKKRTEDAERMESRRQAEEEEANYRWQISRSIEYDHDTHRYDYEDSGDLEDTPNEGESQDQDEAT